MYQVRWPAYATLLTSGQTRHHELPDCNWCSTLLKKVQAKEIGRGLGNVVLHSTPLEAIRAGICAQWSAHNVPHWECQTLQCRTCTTYPVPAEEACKDADAEQILCHVYKYKVLFRIPHMPPAGSLKVLRAPAHQGGIWRALQTKIYNLETDEFVSNPPFSK